HDAFPISLAPFPREDLLMHTHEPPGAPPLVQIVRLIPAAHGQPDQALALGLESSNCFREVGMYQPREWQFRLHRLERVAGEKPAAAQVGPLISQRLSKFV